MFYNKPRNQRCHSYRAVLFRRVFQPDNCKKWQIFFSSCFGNYGREVAPRIYQLGIKNAKSETMKQEICFSPLVFSLVRLLFFNVQPCGTFPILCGIFEAAVEAIY